MPVLPWFLSWLISLFHPQDITHNMFFICFGLCDPSSVSHLPFPLLFIQLVPVLLLHTASLQIQLSPLLPVFLLISYEFTFLHGCSLLQSFISSWSSTSSHLVLISPAGSESLPRITRSHIAPYLPTNSRLLNSHQFSFTWHLILLPQEPQMLLGDSIRELLAVQVPPKI